MGKSEAGDDGRDICWKHNEACTGEKTVNPDKRCGINVTVGTNTNCAAETNTSVHSSESGSFVLPDPLFLMELLKFS